MRSIKDDITSRLIPIRTFFRPRTYSRRIFTPFRQPQSQISFSINIFSTPLRLFNDEKLLSSPISITCHVILFPDTRVILRKLYGGFRLPFLSFFFAITRSHQQNPLNYGNRTVVVVRENISFDVVIKTVEFIARLIQ